MSIVPNNNFSVLPWYRSLQEQNARRWWAYNHVYPLFVPANKLLPFQVLRDSLTSIEDLDGIQFTLSAEQRGWILQDGTIAPTPGGYGFYQSLRPDEHASEDPQALYFYDLPARYEGSTEVEGAVSAIAIDRHHTVLGVFAPDIEYGDTYTGGWLLPDGTDYVLVQTNNNPQSQDVCSVCIGSIVTAPVTSVLLYKSGGEFVRSLSLSLFIKALGGQDCIIYSALLPFPQPISNGQYYLKMSDGTNTWYSEIFTAVNDIEPYLKIEWWDEENFVMDAGTIVYNGYFKNTLYLPSDLAKPEYEFEEEGENRDGYFFPIKQISQKLYHFRFLAPEYLLDVMRFIRMADHIRITYHGQVYLPDTFLITPEWEGNGDVANVEAEFTTSTVAKKIGLGYLRARRGDFNNDFNQDYDT